VISKKYMEVSIVLKNILIRSILRILTGQSIFNKVLFILGLILFLIGSGTLIGYFVFQVPLGDAIWWTWTHLIDPGFLGDDKDDTAKKIIGTIFAMIGMIVIAGTFIAILDEIVRRTVEHMRRGGLPADMSNHTVLVGAGKKLPYFIAALSRLPDPATSDNTVIVVPEPSMLDEARGLCRGSKHFAAERIWEEKAMDRLKLYNAQRIILLDNFGGSNGDMFSLLLRLQNLKKDKADTKMYVEINNRKLLNAMQLYIETLHVGHNKMEIHTMNMADAAARILLRDNPLDCAPFCPVVLIITGWSRFAEALLQQVIRVAHYAVKPTKIIVACEDIDELAEKVRSDMPGLDSNEYARSILSISCVKKFIPGEHGIEDSNSATIAVCGDNADDVFSDAVHWQASHVPGLKQIFVELPDGSGYGDVIGNLPDNPIVPKLIIAGSHSNAFCLAEEMDKVARELHQRYLEQRKAEKKHDPAKNMQDRNWENLNETTRGWNRTPADHAAIKLRSLADHFRIQRHSLAEDGTVILNTALSTKVRDIIEHVRKKLSEQRPEIEMLAEMEHDRWSAERISEGWQYAPDKNAELKQNPYLVNYQELGETIKQYDRESVAETLKAYTREARYGK